MKQNDLHSIAERFKRLYVPAVNDVLDSYGLRHQYVHHSIRPLDHRHKIAGPAFTIVSIQDSTMDHSKRMGPKVIDHIGPGVVAAYDTSGDETTGVWGELWSAGAATRGCVGAIVDGGVRDTAAIREAGFPLFYKFTSPADAVGRTNVIDFDCPINIGGVRVKPGDYIFADEDGIVIIPAELTLEVLSKSEVVFEKESKIRSEIRDKNKSLAELYVEFGKF